ncbi:hypothetical protein BU24DRAFT_412938 [Aaosphaeria arxii CBS 175.79]|uniref:Uncharacterized protein n=1 Tax=Aaosphaeria arxii CBS 175.79 TaxID=1450172 RepID=A0A6A5XFV2_9PLEO|nr:uncharacterized protein BU24DRAFT_412938 [Aaosphaeria arxii CBS 175.79]KAF2011254.1 hypothetical protein BU24DRAFT_412938 [Aaosphaeria arxii CBS 175.79]
MSITFGSFGDIVAAVQVGYKFVQVLDSQKGAKTEFNELLVELRLFSGLLDLLVKQWPTRRECPALKELYDVLVPAVREVKGEINTCLEGMINKYGRSMFAPDNERRGAKDIAKMFQWHVLDRNSATRLSEKVKTCRGVIQVIQGQANLIVEEHDSTVLAENLTALKKAESDAARILDERLCTLEHKVENQYGYLTSIFRIVDRLGAVIPYAENSVLLEDALGYTVQFPLDWVDSIEHSLRQAQESPWSNVVRKSNFCFALRTAAGPLFRRDPRLFVGCPSWAETYDVYGAQCSEPHVRDAYLSSLPSQLLLFRLPK